MGKNLKGKELGKGLSQRKDGKYSAGFLSTSGKRVEKYFSGFQEARRWLEIARENDGNNGLRISPGITYSEWFEYWLENFKAKTIRRNTYRNYIDRYQNNIKPVIGNMKLTDIKPMHCQSVLNRMEKEYAGSTIHMTLLKCLR